MDIKEETALNTKDKQGRVPKADERYRTFLGVLYPDSEIYDYEEVLNNLKGYCKYYAYMEHEPEKGEGKKHTHFIVHFDNPRFVDTLAKQLNIPVNYFQIPLSIRGSIRYLVHIDFPEKIQYEIDNISCSKSYLKNVRQAFDDEKLDSEILSDIFDFINENYKGRTPIELEVMLSMYVSSQSYQRIFRMYYSTICKLISSKYEIS